MPGCLCPTNSHVELITFQIGDACFGIDILLVQEINKLTEVTRVPLAPDYVKGILNLRGRVITVIDIGKRLGVSSRCEGKSRINIIVNFENEMVGLLVDSIGEVLPAESNLIEQMPSNVDSLQGRFYTGVLKAEKQLISILNLAEVLDEQEMT